MNDQKPGFLAQLKRNESGLALVEFALSLPILTMLSVGFIELGRYVNAHTRVSQIALSVADNTGRVVQSIDITDVDAAMIGARIAGESIDFAENGRVILSMIEWNGMKNAKKLGQQITWQRCFGAKNVVSSYGLEGAGKNNRNYEDGFGPADNKISASEDKGVMFVEVVYDYQPIFPVGDSMVNALAGRTVRATAAYPVRERSNNALTNGFNLASNDVRQRACNVYGAT